VSGAYPIDGFSREGVVVKIVPAIQHLAIVSCGFGVVVLALFAERRVLVYPGRLFHKIVHGQAVTYFILSYSLAIIPGKHIAIAQFRMQSC
jgi:hypothetical protein